MLELVGLVFLALIAYNIYKLVKLSSLSATDFPNIPAGKFNEWKDLEQQSVYIFLFTIVVSWVLSYVGTAIGSGLVLLIASIIFWGGIIVAAIRGSKAGKIKKSLQFDWRRPVQVVQSSSSLLSMELEFWQSIKDSKNSEDFQAYIRKYPKGQFVELAKNRVREFRNIASP
ncbi:MAG TPA: hypothetical protein VK612_11760 [Pyrinomonadaceae bacterium]|nr:hypothetical protein [Pyrinomonadaceae bacterium]